MRSIFLCSHRILLFCLVGISLSFCGVSFNVVDAVSTGTVDFVGSEVTSNITAGAHYQHDGKRKVSNNVEVTAEGVSRSVVLEEKWTAPLGKPPDITVFTFKVTAKGQGRILLTLNRDDGGPTSNEDVGSYRGMDNPAGLDDEVPFFLKQHVPHENIRKYETGFDSPYDDDCVPVKHKGYDLEVVSGQEDLDAVGKAYAEKVSISYGTEESAQQALGLTAGWDTAAIEANFVHGTKSSWGWKLVGHSENYTADSMDSTFSVTVDDIISIQNGPPQDPPCEICDNCGDYVHNKDDHYLGLCPIDTLNFVEVPGCGDKRWSCETTKVKNWHAPRDCTNIGVTPGECFIQFRHCTNGNCFNRIIFRRGHSDGSISEAPTGVMNAYADSHNFETPPDDGDDDGELVSNPSSPGLRSVNGSYYAYPGDTHEASVITSEAYYTNSI